MDAEAFEFLAAPAAQVIRMQDCRYSVPTPVGPNPGSGVSHSVTAQASGMGPISIRSAKLSSVTFGDPQEAYLCTGFTASLLLNENGLRNSVSSMQWPSTVKA